MKTRLKTLPYVVAVLLSAGALFSVGAATPDLARLDQQMTGKPTEVLVLGTVHLSELPDSFDATALQPLLVKLAAFKPEIITIEALSGEECDLALRHPGKYGTDYCAGTEVAQRATGLDVPAAMAKMTALLKSLPAVPSAAQRRQLAAVMLAANDRASAYVQWLQLAAAEQRPADGLDQSLVELLQKINKRNNENYQLAARLAAQLGHSRVYATDNHTGDNIAYTDREAFGKEVMAAWEAGKGAMTEWEAQVNRLKQGTDLLPLYRYINEPVHLQALAEINVSAALRAKSATGYPQVWVSGWDIRNLRMVANVAETFRERPGARVLSVVGVSHKPWFDHWLSQLQGVRVVDTAAVLAAN